MTLKSRKIQEMSKLAAKSTTLMVCNISLALLLPGHCTKLGETEWSAEPSHQSVASAISSQKQRENAESESSSLALRLLWLPVQEMHKGTRVMLRLLNSIAQRRQWTRGQWRCQSLTLANEQDKQKKLLTQFVDMLTPKVAKPNEVSKAKKPNEAS